MTAGLVRSLVAGLAAAALPFAAAASVRVPVSVPMTASITTTATADGCSNNPGPFISLEGTISLGGLNGQLRFSNNLRGTHERTEDVLVDVQLVSTDPIRFAKQPPEGGVGGNPYIYLQLNDCSTGEALGSAIKLGRCVQGLSITSVDTLLTAAGELSLTSGSCDNNPGPFITLEGELSLGGICGTLIFTNNARFTHVAEADVTVELQILPEGQSIRFAKQPPQGGVGGNPLIFLQLETGSGAPIGGEIALGRCNQMD